MLNNFFIATALVGPILVYLNLRPWIFLAKNCVVSVGMNHKNKGNPHLSISCKENLVDDKMYRSVLYTVYNTLSTLDKVVIFSYFIKFKRFRKKDNIFDFIQEI